MSFKPVPPGKNRSQKFKGLGSAPSWENSSRCRTGAADVRSGRGIRVGIIYRSIIVTVLAAIWVAALIIAVKLWQTIRTIFGMWLGIFRQMRLDGIPPCQRRSRLGRRARRIAGLSESWIIMPIFTPALRRECRSLPESLVIEMAGCNSLTIEAGDGYNPSVSPLGGDLIVIGDEQEEATLRLNGLWCGGKIVTAGNLRLEIDHCTIKPNREADQKQDSIVGIA